MMRWEHETVYEDDVQALFSLVVAGACHLTFRFSSRHGRMVKRAACTARALHGVLARRV